MLLIGPILDNKNAGGIVTHIKNLLKASRCVNTDFIYDIFESVNIRNKFDLFLIFKNLRKLYYISIEFQVVHINISLGPTSIIKGVLFLIIVKLAKVKRIIVQFHGGSIKKLGLFSRLLLKVFNLSNIVIFLTREQKKDFDATSCNKKTNTILIPNFVFVPDAIKLISKKIIKDNEPIRVLFLGRVVEEKGVFSLLKAAKCISSEKRLSIHFTIDGVGKDLIKAEEYVKENHLSEIISLPGFVSGKKKIELLRRSHIFVLPSWHPEGIPYSLLESMAYGLPAIATCIGGIPDVIDNNLDGILISSPDPEEITRALLIFLQNRDLLALMGENAREKIKNKYDIQVGIRQFQSIYFAK